MNITAVRHGETNENAHGIIQGQGFGTLSDRGKEQIAQLGKDLSNENFDIVYCSDLDRCIKTAAAITEYHADTPVTYDPRLRERSMKPLEGQSFEASDAMHLLTWDAHAKTDDGESWMDVCARVELFVEDLKKTSHEDVLIVTHGGPLKALAYILDNISIDEALLELVDNCAVKRWTI